MSFVVFACCICEVSSGILGRICVFVFVSLLCVQLGQLADGWDPGERMFF